MSVFAELKRRNVFRVAAAYIIVAWLVMQVAEVMGPALRLPDWATSFVAFIVILGFPVAMVLAWAFEMTPEGLRKEKDVNRTESITHVTGQKLNRFIFALLVIAVAYLSWDKFFSTDTPVAVDTEESAQEAPQQIDLATAKPTDPKLADDKSIAVLPFQNRSANEENAAFFADGVHDELLTSLSKIGELRVISRTSVMRYRDTDKSMRQIGEELGVAALLEGGVQRAGNQLRVNVQLIDASRDEHLWADTYDRELTTENVFAIQSGIALAIADALEATLSPQVQTELARISTDNLEAYDLYLRAMQLIDRANWSDMEQALTYIEEAIELDADFQPAWVLKAQILMGQYNTGARTLEAVKLPIDLALEQALTLNQDSSPAHGARAAYLALLGEPGALGEFEQALLLDPNNVQILDDYAGALSRNSQPEKALELALRARDLDPLSSSAWFRLARILEQVGQLEEALEAYSRVRELDPASSSGKGPTAGPFYLQGKIYQALYWIHEGWKVDPVDLDLPNWIVRDYITLGDPDSARAWLETIVNQNPEFPMTLANQAILEMRQGRVDEAVRLAVNHLSDGHDNRWGSATVVSTTLLIDAVKREDPTVALDLLRRYSPELFLPVPVVSSDNVLLAVDTAHLLLLDGQHDAAEKLLGIVVSFADQPYALTGSANSWRVTAKARALALLDEEDAALRELQMRIDAGWRVLWRLQLLHNPNFDGLRKNPKFQKMVEDLEDDMQRQLRQVRSMEATGEIPAPPGTRS